MKWDCKSVSIISAATETETEYMNLESKHIKLPKFDRASVFAFVEASKRRFETYTAEQRKSLYESAKALRDGQHAARRSGH